GIGRETVADPGLGADKARAVGVLLELAAQAPDVDAQRVVRHAGGGAPDGGEQLPGSPDGARLAEESREQAELGRREVHFAAGFVNGAGFEIHGDVRETVDGRLLTARLAPAQEGPGTGQELSHPEWLRHVVVGAGVEELDLLALLAAYGQDQDGNGGGSA